MIVTENYIRTVIRQTLLRESLLKEESESAYARFVHNMEKLAAFSEKAIGRWKDSPDTQKALKKLRDKLVAKVQGDFPGTIDLNQIDEIIDNAKQLSESDPVNYPYAETVIKLANSVWSSNIGQARHADPEHGGHSLIAADPKARGEVAKSLDRTLKYAWKKEADQPENKQFWDNFEVWHAIGGIVGERGGFNHETVLGFLDAFKTPNPHEMSAYGWHGSGNLASNKDRMNIGITKVINDSRGWKDKVHVKLDGKITFAANFDITTQWFSYKEDDESDFEKAGDLNKMLTSGRYGSLITGPKDKLLGGQDTYNEIVIKDAKVTAIAMPDSFFEELKNIGEHRVANMNLLYVAKLIREGDTDQANEELLNASRKTGMYSGSNWYASAVHQLIDAMVSGDKSEITEENRIINILKYISKYTEYDIEIYHINGKNKKDYVLNFVESMKTCIDFIENNPAIATRKDYTWLEFVAEKNPKMGKGLQSFIEFMKDEKIKNFIKSKEGKHYLTWEFKKLNFGTYVLYIDAYQKIIDNPEAVLSQIVPRKYFAAKKSLPLMIDQASFAGIIMELAKNQGMVPFAEPPKPPPPRSSSDLISPPYYVRLRWTEANGENKSYADVGGQQIKPHQNNASTIIDWNQSIVSAGGSIEVFEIWDGKKGKYIPVNSREQLLNLLVPPPPPAPLNEITLSRKQIRNLIKKIL